MSLQRCRARVANFSLQADGSSDYGVFPREREGNEYATNWSLAEDGVIATGTLFSGSIHTSTCVKILLTMSHTSIFVYN